MKIGYYYITYYLILGLMLFIGCKSHKVLHYLMIECCLFAGTCDGGKSVSILYETARLMSQASKVVHPTFLNVEKQILKEIRQSVYESI